MSTNYVVKGLPDGIIQRNIRDGMALRVVDNCLHTSKADIIIGNQTNYVLATPAVGSRIVIKGVSIIGEGNTGTIKILRENNGVCILPCYMSVRQTSSASSALNIILDIDEKVLVTTVSRGASDESFVGVSYIEV